LPPRVEQVLQSGTELEKSGKVPGEFVPMESECEEVERLGRALTCRVVTEGRGKIVENLEKKEGDE
jgi:hypothetical protein